MPRIGRRRSDVSQPRTVMGQWLRAFVLRDANARQQLGRRLNGGKIGFNRDEAGVVQAACELVVRRLWGTEYNVRDITAAVSFMREANLAKGKEPPYGQLEMEAVIRSALGETDVDISGIPRPLAYEVQILTTAYAAAKLSMLEPEIVQLIADAEQIAIGRGWNPPLVA